MTTKTSTKPTMSLMRMNRNHNDAFSPPRHQGPIRRPTHTITIAHHPQQQDGGFIPHLTSTLSESTTSSSNSSSPPPLLSATADAKKKDRTKPTKHLSSTSLTSPSSSPSTTKTKHDKRQKRNVSDAKILRGAQILRQQLLWEQQQQQQPHQQPSQPHLRQSSSTRRTPSEPLVRSNHHTDESKDQDHRSHQDASRCNHASPGEKPPPPPLERSRSTSSDEFSDPWSDCRPPPIQKNPKPWKQDLPPSRKANQMSAVVRGGDGAASAEGNSVVNHQNQDHALTTASNHNQYLMTKNHLASNSWGSNISSNSQKHHDQSNHNNNTTMMITTNRSLVIEQDDTLAWDIETPPLSSDGLGAIGGDVSTSYSFPEHGDAVQWATILDHYQDDAAAANNMTEMPSPVPAITSSSTSSPPPPPPRYQKQNQQHSLVTPSPSFDEDRIRRANDPLSNSGGTNGMIHYPLDDSQPTSLYDSFEDIYYDDEEDVPEQHPSTTHKSRNSRRGPTVKDHLDHRYSPKHTRINNTLGNSRRHHPNEKTKPHEPKQNLYESFEDVYYDDHGDDDNIPEQFPPSKQNSNHKKSGQLPVDPLPPKPKSHHQPPMSWNSKHKNSIVSVTPVTAQNPNEVSTNLRNPNENQEFMNHKIATTTRQLVLDGNSGKMISIEEPPQSQHQEEVDEEDPTFFTFSSSPVLEDDWNPRTNHSIESNNIQRSSNMKQQLSSSSLQPPLHNGVVSTPNRLYGPRPSLADYDDDEEDDDDDDDEPPPPPTTATPDFLRNSRRLSYRHHPHVLSPLSIEYKHLKNDHAYQHAMSAGYLWQSMVGQHVRFPKHWWKGARSPPMGLEGEEDEVKQEIKSSVLHRRHPHSSGWRYVSRHTVMNHHRLNRWVPKRSSAGQVLLHVLVQDLVTWQPVMDVVVGCFHTNARGVRSTEHAVPEQESCREVYMAIRKRWDQAVTVVDCLLWNNSSHSKFSTNNNSTIRNSRRAEKEEREGDDEKKNHNNKASPQTPTVASAAATTTGPGSTTTDAYYESPLMGSRHFVTNANIRVIFGESPPLRTVFMLESELYEYLIIASAESSSSTRDVMADTTVRPPSLLLLDEYFPDDDDDDTDEDHHHLDDKHCHHWSKIAP